MDLYVRTPNNNTIYYINPGPDAGTDFGQLDHDDASTGPENIFWDTGATPPSGTYDVCVETYFFSPSASVGNPIDVTVTVRVPGQSDQVFNRHLTTGVTAGLCTSGSGGYVTSFTFP